MATAGGPAQPNWFQRHTVLGVVGIVIGAIVLIGGVSSAVENHSSSTGNEEEGQFISIVQRGQSAADTDNEIEVVKARHARASALCQLLPSTLRVADWTGTIESISTTLGGDSGVLSVDLGHNIAVQTWNNGLSDIGENTLISTDSPLYAKLATLSDGDRVVFSGQFLHDDDKCIHESSLIDKNGMETPDFTFRFATIDRAR